MADADTTDNDVVKISSIGFVTTTTTTQDADLSFTFTNIDLDGDVTTTQVLKVHLEGSSTFVGTTAAEAIEGTSANESLTGNGNNDVFVLEGNATKSPYDYRLQCR